MRVQGLGGVAVGEGEMACLATDRDKTSTAKHASQTQAIMVGRRLGRDDRRSTLPVCRP